MTNPYQTPPTTNEPARPRRALWRQIAGILCLLVSSLPILYGGLIVSIVVVSGSGTVAGPVSPKVVLILGGLILFFGLGLGAFGLGMWMQHGRLTAYGTAAAFISIVAYLAAAMLLI